MLHIYFAFICNPRVLAGMVVVMDFREKQRHVVSRAANIIFLTFFFGFCITSRSVGQPMEIRQRMSRSWRSATLNQDEDEMVATLSSSATADIEKNLDPLLLRAARGEVCRPIGLRISLCEEYTYIYILEIIFFLTRMNVHVTTTLFVNIEGGENPSMDDATSRKTYAMLS